MISTIVSSSLRRAAASSSVALVSQRQLSMTATQSADKLTSIFEEYRAQQWVTLCFFYPLICYRGIRQLSLTAILLRSSSNLTSYAMELPRRFRQDIAKAASSSRQYNAQATVSADGIENVLQNIGAGNRMSRSEIDEILNEVGVCPVSDGDAQCVIYASQMIELISSKHWKGWCCDTRE